MTSPDDPVRPSRSWTELIATSRARGTRIKRRRRLAAAAPAVLLTLVVGSVIVGTNNPPDRLRTDERRIEIPDDRFPPDGIDDPQTPGPAGTSPSAASPRPPQSLRADGGPAPVAPAISSGPGLVRSDQVAYHVINGAQTQIAVVSGDGSGSRTLTQAIGNNRLPAWSPDGRRIAFVSSRRTYTQYFDREVFDLFVMNADGSNQQMIATTLGAYNGVSFPSWSPDGRRIVFTDATSTTANSDLYVIDADGTDRRNLTKSPDVIEVLPTWGPHDRIAFGDVRGINVINADGSGRRVLLRTGTEPKWSPDGRRITFVTDAPGDAGEEHGNEVFVADADGDNIRKVTSGRGTATNPAFTSGADHVVYSRDPDGVQDTFVLTPGTPANVVGGPQPAALRVIRRDGQDDRGLTAPSAYDNHLWPGVRPRT